VRVGDATNRRLPQVKPVVEHGQHNPGEAVALGLVLSGCLIKLAKGLLVTPGVSDINDLGVRSGGVDEANP